MDQAEARSMQKHEARRSMVQTDAWSKQKHGAEA
jgi:hypothetical protein